MSCLSDMGDVKVDYMWVTAGRLQAVILTEDV
jgi:hypothetical protein